MMKKILLLLILTVSVMSCITPPAEYISSEQVNDESEQILKVEIDTTAELQAIEQCGKILYDWLLKNNYGYINVSNGKNGFCSFDTLAYFSGLRKLGNISKQFIDFEKERVNDCARFISTIKYDDYMNSEMYDFDEHCSVLYEMHWVQDQINIKSFSIKNTKLTNETQAKMDVYLKYSNMEALSSQLFLEKEDNVWKITAVHIVTLEEFTIQDEF